MLRYGLVGAFLAGPAVSAAYAGKPSFTVSFSDCSEFAGEGYVPLAQVQNLVPAGYTITTGPAGQAPIVVRMTSCNGVQVNNTPSRPTTISQVGVNVVSPDSTGTINNYTVIYVTNNPYLVQSFEQFGVPARFDPTITYEYSLNSGGGGVLYGAVPNAGMPAYFLYGPETEPTGGSQVFVANWWHGAYAAVRQQTTFPAISFGTSSVVLYTSKNSALGQLIGGNAYGAFTVLALHGEYASAQMIVTGLIRH